MTRELGEITQSGGIPQLQPTGTQSCGIDASRVLEVAYAAIGASSVRLYVYAAIGHSKHSGTPPAFERASSGPPTIRLGGNTQSSVRSTTLSEDEHMKWTKPEAEIVAVTMEVTAYVATL